MKKIILSVSTILLLASCSGTKDASSSSLTNMAATQLLSTLTKNASMDDITKLFGLLDLNKDKSISKDEAVGDVSSNFDILDKDKNGGLGLSELGGLLGLLK
jgi:Ca2+-binding EF-hand superfamily protein